MQYILSGMQDSINGDVGVIDREKYTVSQFPGDTVQEVADWAVEAFSFRRHAATSRHAGKGAYRSVDAKVPSISLIFGSVFFPPVSVSRDVLFCFVSDEDGEH